MVGVLISFYMILDKNWLIWTLALQQKWYVYIDNLIKTPMIYMILLLSSQYPVTWSWWANVEYRMLPFLFRKKKFNYWKDVCSMVKQVGSLRFRWPTKKTKQGEGHADMGCAALEKILGDVKLFYFFIYWVGVALVITSFSLCLSYPIHIWLGRVLISLQPYMNRLFLFFSFFVFSLWYNIYFLFVYL